MVSTLLQTFFVLFKRKTIIQSRFYSLGRYNKKGRFEDTNKIFVKPEKYNFHVTTQDAKLWAPKIAKELK